MSAVIKSSNCKFVTLNVKSQTGCPVLECLTQEGEHMDLKKLLYSQPGKIIISIILGLGLATMFRKACNERNCLKFIGPSVEELREKTYKFDNKCYTFQTTAETCSKTKKRVRCA